MSCQLKMIPRQSTRKICLKVDSKNRRLASRRGFEPLLSPPTSLHAAQHQLML